MRNDEYEIDEGKSAKFNAGVLQTQRINKIMEVINESKCNPISINVDYGNEWSYNLWFRQINNLYDEIDGFVASDEREFCLKTREKIKNLLKKYPIHEKNKKISNENDNNWSIIQKAIEIYEREVKRLGSKYQIFSAFAEDDEGL